MGVGRIFPGEDQYWIFSEVAKMIFPEGKMVKYFSLYELGKQPVFAKNVIGKCKIS